MAGLSATEGKVLVIFPGALGDFVCFLPTLWRLARNREADLFARTEYGDLLPKSIRVGSLECYPISCLFAPGADREEKLKSFFGSYGLVWSWMGSTQPDFVRHLSALSRGRLRIFPFRPVGPEVHLIDYYLSCLGEDQPREFVSALPLKSHAIAWSDVFWQQNGLEEKKILALAPGSGALEKNWPPEFYKVVSGWWERDLGGRVVVILGPAEEEKTNLIHFWHPMLTARGLTLAQLAALLTRCRLYLGNDSGVSHLAAMLGVETIVLFGPTDPAQWAPRGKRVTVVTQQVECAPCAPSIIKACPHRKCLAALDPSNVIKALEEVLSIPADVIRIKRPS